MLREAFVWEYNTEDSWCQGELCAFGAWGCLKWWQSFTPGENMCIGCLTLTASRPDDDCAHA